MFSSSSSSSLSSRAVSSITKRRTTMKTLQGQFMVLVGGAVVLGLALCLLVVGTAAAGQTFTVMNLLDSGPGSLRAAIDAANTAPGADVIKFAHGLHGTITLASVLNIMDDLTINGPGAQTVTV